MKRKRKKWCYYSCEQNKKSQFIKPGGSNQGIDVSNRYYVLDDKGNKVWKNKVYFSAGNEEKDKPLYLGMMTLSRKNNRDLTKNGSYRTQLKVKLAIPKDVNKECKHREMEGLQYIYGIPRKKLN